MNVIERVDTFQTKTSASHDDTWIKSYGGLKYRNLQYDASQVGTTCEISQVAQNIKKYISYAGRLFFPLKCIFKAHTYKIQVFEAFICNYHASESKS